MIRGFFSGPKSNRVWERNKAPVENLREKDTRVDGTVATEGLPYQNGGKKWVVANYLRKVGYLLPPTSYLLLSM